MVSVFLFRVLYFFLLMVMWNRNLTGLGKTGTSVEVLVAPFAIKNCIYLFFSFTVKSQNKHF